MLRLPRIYCVCYGRTPMLRRGVATSLQTAQAEEAVRAHLQSLMHPTLGVTLGDCNYIGPVMCKSEDGKLRVTATLTPFTPAASYVEALRHTCEKAARESVQQMTKQYNIGDAVGDVSIQIKPGLHSRPALAAVGKGVEGVGSVIAVSSGKGGVGKSTVAVNLAFALAQRGARVGLLDADLHGPSLPVMVRPTSLEVRKDINGMINALQYHNVKMMSYGWVSPKNKHGERTGAVMRGPLASSLLQQLIKFTDWGQLDHLIVDMPPGTGDVHITLGQTLPISTSVVVTTPQTLALVDVAKGLDLFASLKVPTSALVVNMSKFIAPDTKRVYFPFGDPSIRTAKILSRFSLPRTFMLPLSGDLTESGDSGRPYVIDHEGDDDTTAVFHELAGYVAAEAEKAVVFADANIHSKSAPVTNIAHATVTFDEKKHAIALRIFREDGAREYKLKPYETRLECRCAKCVDEATGEKLLDPTKIPSNIVPTNIQPQGNYGCAIQWSDGHASGIYTYEQLEALARATPVK